MSPEQLKTLQNLSELFEEGVANPQHIKQLSILLAEINQKSIYPEEALEEVFPSY